MRTLLGAEGGREGEGERERELQDGVGGDVGRPDGRGHTAAAAAKSSNAATE